MKIRKVQLYCGEPIETFVEYAEGLFFIRLPEKYYSLKGLPEVDDLFLHVSNRVKGEHIGDSLEEEAVAKVKRYLKFYEAHSTQKRKVIVFRIDYRSRNVSWNHGKYEGDDSAEIKFDYFVGYQYKINDKYSLTNEFDSPLRYSWVSENTIGRDEWHIVDWTEEREAYCKELYKAMEQLMQKMDTLLGNGRLFIEAVDFNFKLLR